MFRSDANVREVPSAGSRPWPAGASAASWGGWWGGGPSLDLQASPPPVAHRAGPPGEGWGRPSTSSGYFSRLRARDSVEAVRRDWRHVDEYTTAPLPQHWRECVDARSQYRITWGQLGVHSEVTAPISLHPKHPCSARALSDHPLPSHPPNLSQDCSQTWSCQLSVSWWLVLFQQMPLETAWLPRKAGPKGLGTF